MLNELEKRKEDLVEHDSVPVTFADGQTWHVLKPWREIRPVFKDGAATTSYRAFGYGPPIDDLVEMMAGLADFDEVASAAATLAGCLLRLQYDLDDGELDQLLAFRMDDADSLAWMTGVVAIATGKHGRRRGSEVSGG